MNRLIASLLSLTFILSLGVGGYYFICEASLLDAVYMTVITVSTVGYSEVIPLNSEAKIFTIILILSSIGLYAYVVSVITQYIINGQIYENYIKRQNKLKMRKFNNHIIVCGYGRNGEQVVKKLLDHKFECVVVEKDEEKLEELKRRKNLVVIEGDITEDGVLESAGISFAKSLITTLPKDSDNLFVVISARQKKKDLIIISRAQEDSSVSKLKIAGADQVIIPDKIGGDHMATLLVSPGIIEFIENLSESAINHPNLREIHVNEIPDKSNHKSILELNLRNKTGCLVVGFKNEENEYIINPDPNTILTPNSKIIVMGNSDQIESLNKIL